MWGENNLTHSFGEDPSAPAFTNAASPMYHMRGFYMWPGPYNGNPRTPNIPFVEDWGCPKIDDHGSGTLGQAKFAGTVTLHADTSPQNPADDISQPRTTWYISPDITINAATSPSQYDEVFMNDRWAAITEGNPLPGQQHDVLVGDRYANSYVDSRRQAGGGVAQGQGFGPYRLAPGDSVHIVFAEGVSGISWEKGREVGSNWLQYKNHTGTPALVMPGGATTVDQNAYKKAWFYTGVDSILKTYRNAQNTWAHIEAGTNPPQPPDAPSSFTVLSGGDRIQLAWAGNAASNPHFGGYVIYRAKGKVLDWDVSYERIYETSSAITSYDDTSATRGFDYYYYIQSKDDGTQIPGTILYSSQTLTVTSAPALLGRPAGTALQAVRVVPNPYDIRARAFQFGATSQYDRIAFYGLPPGCLVKIYTESGELIYQKVHTRPVGDEVWDSKTSSGQIIVSGVYILYVEVTQDTYDTWDRKDGRLLYRKGESVFRKFVVIR